MSVRNVLRQIAPARRLWYEWRIRRCPPIVVYQMGKVGSYAVYRSLFQWWPGAVLHAHRLSDRYDDVAIRSIDRSCFGGDCPVYLVSLVREPIARNVSAFFETYDWYFGTAITEAEKSLQELQKTFIAEYQHGIPLMWFDERLFPVTGIDVYEEPFLERGHQQYSRQNVNLLVMRTDLDNSRKAEVLHEFLPDRATGVPTIERKNAGEDKAHRDLYRRFKAQFAPPSWYVGTWSTCTARSMPAISSRTRSVRNFGGSGRKRGIRYQNHKQCECESGRVGDVKEAG